MRVAVVALVAVAFQADTTAAPLGTMPIAPPCVSTEHMPVAGLGQQPHDPMPVLRVDSTSRSRMPVLRLQACFLLDPLRADSLKRSR